MDESDKTPADEPDARKLAREEKRAARQAAAETRRAGRAVAIAANEQGHGENARTSASAEGEPAGRVTRPAISRGAGKPSVVLAGFFGRGNAGDEAFLHAQYELLKDDYKIIVPIEHKNAHPGFHTWEPYNRCEIINYDEVPRIYGQDVVALHSGGGSLPFAHSGQFLLAAMDAGRRTLISGVDAAINRKWPRDHIRYDIFGRLDFFSVRTVSSLIDLREKGVLVHHGADWAIGLKAVEVPHAKRGGALVTIRNFGKPLAEHIVAVTWLHKYLERQGHRVRYLPFAPDDRGVLDRYPTATPENIENLWHDPRQVLGLIAGADVVVSLGRLHTLIMSLLAGVPTVAIDPRIPSDKGISLNRKNLGFCLELGLPFFYNVDEMITEYGDDFNRRVVARRFPADYIRRFNEQAGYFRRIVAGEEDDGWKKDTNVPVPRQVHDRSLREVPLSDRLGSADAAEPKAPESPPAAVPPVGS